MRVGRASQILRSPRLPQDDILCWTNHQAIQTSAGMLRKTVTGVIIGLGVLFRHLRKLS